MIVDSPFIPGLAVGTDRVVPTDGDAQLFIPASLQPVIIPITPHNVATTNNDNATGSRIAQRDTTTINQPVSFLNVLNLPKGFYTLEMNLAARGNFVPASTLDTVAIILLYQGFLIPLGSVMWTTTTTQNIEIRRTLLLTSDASIQVQVPATDAVATNRIDFRICVNAMRHL